MPHPVDLRDQLPKMYTFCTNRRLSVLIKVKPSMNHSTTQEDQLITLRELRNRTAGRCGDGRMNIRTLHRYIQRGVRGHRLWARKTTAGWVTTVRAWDTFLAATDEALRTGAVDKNGGLALPAAITPSQRARRLAKVDAELHARGL